MKSTRRKYTKKGWEIMERCSPVEMRRALEIVDAMKTSGIKFVPIPVMNDRDQESLNKILMRRLDRMVLAAKQ